MQSSKKEIEIKLKNFGVNALTDLELFKLTNFKGNYENFYNSIQLRAVKELVRRKEVWPGKEFIFKKSKDIAEYCQFLNDIDHEEFWVLLLNNRCKLIAFLNISKGGMTGTVVDTLLLLNEVVMHKAKFVALMHNHPSGVIIPSDADKNLTEKIIKALKLFDVGFLDHVIVAKNRGYYSFADEGLM